LFKKGDLVRPDVHDSDPIGFGVVLGPSLAYSGWYKVYFGVTQGIRYLPKSCLRLAKST